MDTYHHLFPHPTGSYLPFIILHPSNLRLHNITNLDLCLDLLLSSIPFIAMITVKLMVYLSAGKRISSIYRNIKSCHFLSHLLENVNTGLTYPLICFVLILIEICKYPFLNTCIQCVGELRIVENFTSARNMNNCHNFLSHIVEDHNPGPMEPSKFNMVKDNSKSTCNIITLQVNTKGTYMSRILESRMN